MCVLCYCCFTYLICRPEMSLGTQLATRVNTILVRIFGDSQKSAKYTEVAIMCGFGRPGAMAFSLGGLRI